MKLQKSYISVFTVFTSFFLFGNYCSGQTRFEKGFFITNSGTKTACLIRNTDWVYNPTSFDYKIGEGDKIQTAVLADVQEFLVEGKCKYIRAAVKMDRSSDALIDNEISTNMAPEWKDETVWLKVLIEGSATLFSYQENGLTRFFYSVNNSPATALIYKRYQQQGVESFQYNRNYINQLLVEVNCLQSPVQTIENVEYDAKSLAKWFRRDNECRKTPQQNFSATKKHSFSPKIFIGSHLLHYKAGSPGTTGLVNIDYGKKASVTFGIEAEYFLPFNNRRWSVFGEGKTLSYKATGVNATGNKVSIDYNAVNIGIGFRYHAYIQKDWKALAGIEFIKDLKIPHTGISTAFGIGVSYRNFTAEWRYILQDLIYRKVFDDTERSTFSNMMFVVKFGFL